MIKDKVAALVTVYNPDIEDLICNLKSYYDQFDFIIFSDNSDKYEFENKFKFYLKELKKISYINMGGNCGIAGAQNKAYELGIQLGAEFFVEIDQDSKLPKNFVSDMRLLYSELNKTHKILGIGPLAISKKTNEPYRYKKGRRILEVNETLSSGFFVSKEAFEIVGPKREEFFIDYVDWEWCWRGSKKGFKTFIAPFIEMEHQLGDGHKKFLYFFNIGVPSPIRHYYQIRNNLFLFRITHCPLSWKVKRTIIVPVKLIYYCFLLPDSYLRRKYILKAFVDACRNKMGRIDE